MTSGPRRGLYSLRWHASVLPSTQDWGRNIEVGEFETSLDTRRLVSKCVEVNNKQKDRKAGRSGACLPSVQSNFSITLFLLTSNPFPGAQEPRSVGPGAKGFDYQAKGYGNRAHFVLSKDGTLETSEVSTLGK